MDVTSPKQWLTPALVSFLWLSGSTPRWDSPWNALPWLISLSPSLSILSIIFSKWAENEWEGRKRGLQVKKREMERGAILIVTGQSYWEPDSNASASLWRCGDEVMGWWWHLEMEGWRWRGRWRANAYRSWPLGSEMPLSWQGWASKSLRF